MKKFADYLFFHNIDTEEKAYWLGFIYADGSIIKDNKKHARRLSIHLKVTDEQHLQKFKNCIKAEHSLNYTKSTYRGKTTYGVRIQIGDPILIKDLEALGVIQNKTYMPEVSFDIVPKHLQRHFIRGYFDGDGTISKTKVSTTGAIPFSDAFERYLQEQDIIYTTRLRGLKTPLKDIYISRKKEQIKFLDLIYRDSTMYLDRKYDLYVKLFSPPPLHST